MSEPLEDSNDDVRYPARRKMVIFLIVSVSLFALIFAAVEIENWRGRSAWNKYQREAEAKGETFDILKLAPPIIPNESNFASVPMFAKLFEIYRDEKGKPHLRETDELNENTFNIWGSSDVTPPDLGNWIIGKKIDLREWQIYYRNVRPKTNDWRYRSGSAHDFPVPVHPGKPSTDVLAALFKLDQPLANLRVASARPFSRFPVNYEDHVFSMFPHLFRLKTASQFLNLRASANLRQPEEAADNVILNLRVANALRGEPSLLSQQVRGAIATIALHPMWEGLDEQVWNDAQLLTFQKELGKFDLLESYELAIRGERAFNKLTMDTLRTNISELVGFTAGSLSDMSSIRTYLKGKIANAPYYMMPNGWLYQNQLTISRLYGIALTIVDPASQRIDKNNLMQISKALSDSHQGFVPYNMFVGMLFPAVDQSVLKFAFAQTAVDQAILACALERHRLAHGSFPETLADLSPEFIERIPHDIINGEPLKYRLTADGKFILHSVGWNETDDGGTVALSSSGRSHRMEEGDWVWSYSTNSSNEKPSEPGSDSP